MVDKYCTRLLMKIFGAYDAGGLSECIQVDIIRVADPSVISQSYRLFEPRVHPI